MGNDKAAVRRRWRAIVNTPYKNTQKLSALNGKYQSTFIDKTQSTFSLKRHIDKYSITFVDSDHYPDAIMRQHNYANVVKDL